MHSLLINSKNRTSGTASNFTIRSNRYIEGSFNVKNISLTNTFYLIQTGVNDTITINATNIVLVPASYNLGTLITTLQGAFTAAFGAGQITISLNAFTGRILISGAAVFTMVFPNELKYLLGFTQSSHAGATSYNAENFTNVTRLNLGIRINEAAHETSVYNFVNDGISAHLYFKSISNFGDVMTQTYDQVKQQLHFTQRTNQLTISIIDLLTGDLVSLNNCDFEI